MCGLTRDGTAEPLSRDKILRSEREQGKINFRVQLTISRIGNQYLVDYTLMKVLTIHIIFLVENCR